MLKRKINVIVQLGKHSKCLCVNNDGKIMTNLRLRQEVHHLDLWETFPGDIILS